MGRSCLPFLNVLFVKDEWEVVWHYIAIPEHSLEASDISVYRVIRELSKEAVPMYI